MSPRPSHRLRRPLVRAALAALVVVAVAACGEGDGPGSEALSYTGRASCAGCHAEQVTAYAGSDHDRAMDHATPETVLGDFSGVTLTHAGVETRLEERDGRFWITTDGPDGAAATYEVRYTFGVRPLQQYLVELEGGRIQRLAWSWDARPAEEGGQRWFHIYGEDVTDPDDILHWTRPSQGWNRMCADCHSTNLEKGYDAAADAYRTTWSEIDVSCEACHGPASGHLAWAAAEDAGPAPEHAGFPVGFARPGEVGWVREGEAATATRAPPRADDRELEACARCHAHRTPIAEHEAGRRFADTYRLSLPQAPLYHADGQVREEVFVYGSFLQSRMYAAGVGCTDCHDPHTAELRVEGNALCTGCHSASTFDRPGHHRHESGRAGSACVGCHMPETTFMQVDPRRDHGFRVPRPTAAGAPDACVSCHETRDAAWVRATLDGWYGPPDDSAAHRRARAFEGAERGDPGALPRLRRIAADGETAALVRAAAVSYLGRYPSPAALGTLSEAVGDPDPRVRAEAARALRMLEPAERTSRVAPLLEDSTLLVRIAAAQALAPVARATLSPETAAALETASAEYERSRALNADDPAALVELGDYRAERGHLVEAEEAYRRAIELEPAFVPAYLNLADFLRRTGRDADGRTVLEQGRERNPGAPMLPYALGLHHVRSGTPGAALAPLGEAAALDPSDGRFGLALALVLERLGRLDEATATARDLVVRHPDDPGYRALLERLRGAGSP